jgi:hypothetical protein
MSDNISPIGDAVRRMTYAELAAVRGISVPSARRLVLRQGWPRHVSNDSGLVRVLVPAGEAQKSRPGGPRRHTPDKAVVTPPTGEGVTPTTSDSDITVTTRAFEAALAILREQLDRERTRAERAELRIAELMMPWWRRWFRW